MVPASRRHHRAAARTGLVVGLVAGVALLLVLGIGVVLALPKLLGDDETPAGAKAAAQRGQELLASGGYGGYYDVTGNEYKAEVGRADFIGVCTCASASANPAKNTSSPLTPTSPTNRGGSKLQTRLVRCGRKRSGSVVYRPVTLWVKGRCDDGGWPTGPHAGWARVSYDWFRLLTLCVVVITRSSVGGASSYRIDLTFARRVGERVVRPQG